LSFESAIAPTEKAHPGGEKLVVGEDESPPESGFPEETSLLEQAENAAVAARRESERVWDKDRLFMDREV
jgi:hypothetical protein